MGSATEQPKVVFLAPTISRKGGGLADPVRRTAQELQAEGHWQVQVISVEDRFSAEDAPRWLPLKPELIRPWRPRSFGYAPAWKARLNEAQGDLLHIHGLWTYLSLVGSRWSRRHGKPFIVSVHGMLNALALQRSAWKKQLFARLFQKRILGQAACVHALTVFEAEAIRAYGLKMPICVIPNAVDLPADNSESHEAPPWAGQVEAGKKVLLFLSRLHPIKGLVPLLQGLHLLRQQQPALVNDWVLALAGFEEFNHRQELEQMVTQLGLQKQVLFLGPVFGAVKQAALEQAEAYVLPSLSEGMPIAILEAWSHCLPVLCTTTCHLPEGPEQGAAIAVAPTAAALADGLAKMLSRTAAERKSMGQRGRALVEQRFLWKHVANGWDSVYRWIIEGSERPRQVSIL